MILCQRTKGRRITSAMKLLRHRSRTVKTRRFPARSTSQPGCSRTVTRTTAKGPAGVGPRCNRNRSSHPRRTASASYVVLSETSSYRTISGGCTRTDECPDDTRCRAGTTGRSAPTCTTTSNRIRPAIIRSVTASRIAAARMIVSTGWCTWNAFRRIARAEIAARTPRSNGTSTRPAWNGS
uniref:(northern house mosquito) hypothetical protein n=1 Tax=Culex pipiens TaxID=7175 RepID=A0A8D8NSU0_CULPI